METPFVRHADVISAFVAVAAVYRPATAKTEMTGVI